MHLVICFSIFVNCRDHVDSVKPRVSCISHITHFSIHGIFQNVGLQSVLSWFMRQIYFYLNFLFLVTFKRQGSFQCKFLTVQN